MFQMIVSMTVRIWCMSGLILEFQIHLIINLHVPSDLSSSQTLGSE